MFFFFFKQKTAYDMRISDWSSDVCSSDLAAAGVASACGRLCQIDQCRQQASTIFEQLASEQYIEIDCVQRIEAGLKTKRLFGQAQKRHSCRCGPAIFVEEPSDESLKGIEPRSEEHTSELQSLMRISYAVFCLKKKKTKANGHKIKY